MKISSERLVRIEESDKRLREKIEGLTKTIDNLKNDVLKKGFYLIIILLILTFIALGYTEAIKLGLVGMA